MTNPDGTLHRYAWIGETLIPLEPTRRPEYVAPADPLETAAADAAYLAQTVLELWNPPERVMRQGEEVVEINVGDGSVITLVPLDEDAPEVSQVLAEHLWNEHISEWEISAIAVYGSVPQVGTLAYDETVLHFTEKWETFSQGATSADRARAYELRDQLLVSSGGIRSGIEFFDEAGVVNHLLSLGGENLFGQGYVNTLGFSHDPINFGTVNLALNKIGKDLVKQNDEILAALLEAGGKPPSPYYNLVEEMDSPTAARVATAIDWDIHMVWREQAKVQEIIDHAENGIEPKTLEWITDLMTMDASGVLDRDIQEASEAFGWAIVAAGGSLDFAEEEHRRAIGIAMMFRAREYSEQEFGIYYRTMMRSVAEQAGQDVYRLPTVGEVLGRNN